MAVNGNLVMLSIGVQVMNSLLLPIVLGFLFALAARTLPQADRLKGLRAIFTAAAMGLTAGLGIYSACVAMVG